MAQPRIEWYTLFRCSFLESHRVCVQDQSFNDFENDTMKLSVNEAALPGLRAAIQQVLIAKFVFGPRWKKIWGVLN